MKNLFVFILSLILLSSLSSCSEMSASVASSDLTITRDGQAVLNDSTIFALDYVQNLAATSEILDSLVILPNGDVRKIIFLELQGRSIESVLSDIPINSEKVIDNNFHVIFTLHNVYGTWSN